MKVGRMAQSSSEQAAATSPAGTSKGGCPIILVHGFGGWSRDTMKGLFWYWGGMNDLASDLQKNCPYNKILTASVGPFSSVWDRAVELFYQIKGGTVDYGQEHSDRHGHSRYGRTYPGLYPEWDAEHPVHLVGHSMGGLTARALVQMLKDRGSSRGEKDPLFSNVESSGAGFSTAWVKSVVTVSTPHDGSPMVDELDQFTNHVMGLMEAGYHVLGVLSGGSQTFVYDYQLDQWGVEPRKASEGWGAYRQRVQSSRIWKDPPTDFCVFDLSPEGAAELTGWVDEAEDVVYMSFQSCCTWQVPAWLALDGASQWPRASTNVFFLPSAKILGGLQKSGHPWAPEIDTSWNRNDAMVPYRSQHAPTIKIANRPHTVKTSKALRAKAIEEGGSAPEEEANLGHLEPSGKRVVEVNRIAAQIGAKGLRGHFPPKLDPGVWHSLGELDGLDHLQAVGWIAPLLWNATEFYTDLVKLLNTRV